MAKAIEIKLDHSGMGALLKSAEVRAALHDHAEPVLSAAQDSAPVDTGDYKASLHIEDATTDRAVVRVVASDWKAGILEAKYGILARALDAAR